MKKITILMTGSGAPGFVPLYKCIKKGDQNIEIYGCDEKTQTAGCFYVKKHFTVLSGIDKNYISEMLKICKKEHIDIVLPITDQELLPLSKNKNLFQSIGTSVIVSNPTPLAISLNKKTLFEFLQANNLSNPDFFVAKDWSSFEKALVKLGFPKKPICFKPSVSWGSRGFRIIDPKKNLSHLYLVEKPSSKYITFEQAKEILKNLEKFPELLVMEYLPGKEYSVDVLMENNKALYIIPRLRVQMKEGITTEGIIENNKDVITLTKKISEKLKLDFSIGLQCKFDAKGKPKIIEINPRLQGTTVMCLGAGVNIPYAAVQLALNKPLRKANLTFGTHMYRHWQEVFFRNGKKFLST